MPQTALKLLSEELGSISLTDNAKQILLKRYVRRGKDDRPSETIDEMFWRVAYNVAKAENKPEKETIEIAKQYYSLLISKKFFPNSPTFTGAGTPLGQLAACFVVPLSDDMGKREDGIFQTLRNAALIQQTGGGNGFNFSRLRPKAAYVNSSSGQATGPIGFLKVYDTAFGEVAQGGSRRGANMAVLRCDHPDVESFIECKSKEGEISNFNISVGITDAFMKAVKDDADWDLVFPDVMSPSYKDFHGNVEQAIEQNVPLRVYKTVKAKELFNKIVKFAHHNGEPGVLFLDAANRANPVPHLYQLEATNPCGEQYLGPYESCCLGSINLNEHLGENGTVLWDELEKTISLSTRFLDDVIDANAYVPSVPQLKEAAHKVRRIGLGIMGLGDIMYHVGVRYGSKDGQEFASQIMEFIRYVSMKTSIEMAKEKGAFPAINGSIYDQKNMKWEIPQPKINHKHNWGRPVLDWKNIKSDILIHGIRNGAQTTIAPTGTIATVAGCEGYGCEPVFALAYIRHVNDNGKDLKLNYASPKFEASLNSLKLSDITKQEIIDAVMKDGSCQDIDLLPDRIKNVFVVSGDVTAEEHVKMASALQAWVDNSISKTINFPETATESEVASAYISSWEQGCKGITVYVAGSRETVVLETKATASKQESVTNEVVIEELWHNAKEPRPAVLTGKTHSIDTPVGKTFVTINENINEQPFEVFINTAKAGSETAAVSEAIGRLISFILRIPSPVSPSERLREVGDQMKGIGGSRTLGFGPNRIMSLPDGIAKAIQNYTKSKFIKNDEHIDESEGHSLTMVNMNTDILTKVGDLCSQCGEASVINEEGCRKCYSCGYSEC